MILESQFKNCLPTYAHVFRKVVSCTMFLYHVTLYAFLLFSMHATCPPILILLDFIISLPNTFVNGILSSRPVSNSCNFIAQEVRFFATFKRKKSVHLIGTHTN